MSPHYSILQVNTVDNRGGAARIAWTLHRAYQKLGLRAWMAVGQKFSDDPAVLLIPNQEATAWATRTGLKAASVALDSGFWGMRRLGKALRSVAELGRMWDLSQGIEDFRYPGTWRLLELTSELPDIVHCHNLHGGYFDLRALSWLNQQVPVVLTLHDAWLLSGHCAHSFDCERWKTGCGHCPDLTIYPAIRRDATAYNWRRRRAIYARSRFYVATPCRWLMQKVEQSVLAPAVLETRVIPYGIDLSVFRPAGRRGVRAALGIPQDAKVLLCAGVGIRRSPWKDWPTMREAVDLVADRLHDQHVLFIALGDDAPAGRVGRAEIRFVPYQDDPKCVAPYYQAADVYVHPAKADTFPNVVLEALACGAPVVATAVGGIPEQVKGLKTSDLRSEQPDWNRYEINQATGILVPPEDPAAMAAGIVSLLTAETLHRQLSENAVQDAHERFDLNRQVQAYLDWYAMILTRRQVERSTA